MARKIKYYLVAAEALPEIFIRVAEAKRMMQTGEADTVGAATKMAGISRSAFYKYKDAVQPFNDMKSEHIITFYTLLKDVSGTLSSVLGVFAASGANILTINQSIPTNGCAAVTISAETSAMEKSLEQLITEHQLKDQVEMTGTFCIGRSQEGVCVLVDGEFVQAKHDISLRFRGSSNQRLLDVKKTLAAGQPVWWEDEKVFATHTMEK